MEDSEDNEFIASEHDMLISAVSKLDKTQHVTAPTRSEPTNINSEFNLVKTHKKLNINKTVKVLEDTAHHTEISKRLKRSTDKSRVLSKPLEKPQVERIKRATGYEAIKVKIGRWDPVVARSRTVDFVSFPLKRTSNKLEPTGDFLSKFTLKSPLEKELEQVDPPPPPELEDDEDKVYPMTYQEMLEQRQHLAKLRAQQSYQAAKSKRQGNIKSKKYHRILKKEKLKLQLKEFEELQKTNPEEALKKLDSLEKARALERHTLRHKNTGKWAKSKLVQAKYDKEVRQQLAEQLSVSRGLTEKIQDHESSNDEEEVSNEQEIIPDIKVDPMNPWVLKTSDKSNIDAEFDFGYKKYLKDKMYIRKEDSDSDEQEDNTIISENIPKLRKSINSIINQQHLQKETKTNLINVKRKCNKNVEKKKESVKAKPTISKDKQKFKNKLTATSDWIVEDVNSNNMRDKSNIVPDITKVFETLEKQVSNKVEEKLKKIRKSLKHLEKSPNINSNTNKKAHNEIDNLEYLKFKNQKMKPIIDEALIETKTRYTLDEKSDETNPLKLINTQIVPDSENIDTNIKLPKFTDNIPKYLNTALPNGESGYDRLDDDDEQVVPKLEMGAAFEDEDIVASFRKEKEDEINKDQPTDIDNSMPGWGSWGGKGVKAPKRKKNRFILKAPPKMPRKDENKGDIVIKEFKDPKLALHKVKEVPFPFTSVKDYEASIRAPIGNTFIPEKAHKKLIRPSVITKAGTIIEAMDEDELLVARNKNFRNEAVLKLLGQK